MAGVAGKSGGARAGAGRKRKAVEDDLHKRLTKACKKGELDKIFTQLVVDSTSVSFRVRSESRKLLLSYLYGTPVPRVEQQEDEREDLTPPIADAIDRIYGDGDANTGG
jgi:hypothetical protein